LKLFLIILAIVFALFGIVIFSSLRIKICLNKNGFLVIKYLFLSFKYDLYGEKKLKPVKKRSKKASKMKQTKKEGYFKKLYSEDGLLDGTVKLLSTVKEVISKLFALVSECEVEKLNLDITVAADQPSNTAIYYGGVCAAVYPAIGLLNGLVTVKKQNVNIKADYDAKAPNIDFVVIIKLRVFKALKFAFVLIKEFIQGGF